MPSMMPFVGAGIGEAIQGYEAQDERNQMKQMRSQDMGLKQQASQTNQDAAESKRAHEFIGTFTNIVKASPPTEYKKLLAQYQQIGPRAMGKYYIPIEDLQETGVKGRFQVKLGPGGDRIVVVDTMAIDPKKAIILDTGASNQYGTAPAGATVYEKHTGKQMFTTPEKAGKPEKAAWDRYWDPVKKTYVDHQRGQPVPSGWKPVQGGVDPELLGGEGEEGAAGGEAAEESGLDPALVAETKKRGLLR